MVISGASEEERPRKFMAMAPERSRSLHNFSMPCLKWGNQKLLRCMKVNSNGEIPSVGVRSSASEAESEGFIRRTKQTESEKWRSSNGYGSFEKSFLPLTGASGGKSEIERDGDGGFAAIRAKLMFELRTAADKMKLVISEEGEEDDLSAKPWNLRTRRAGCKVPNETGRGGGGSKIEERKQNSSHLQTEISTIKSLRLRGLSPAREVEKKDSPKFSISLSREEVEDDFLSMTGSRPSRRPKKRARIIQKQLDTIFPGLWLSEVTPDSYKVFEIPETGKR